MSKGLHLRCIQPYSITINLPFYMKQDIKKKAEELQEPISNYIRTCAKRFIQFIKKHEKHFLNNSVPSGMKVGSVSKIDKEDHFYLYKLVKQYKLFPSRSELIRFAIFIEKMLEVIPPHLPEINSSEEVSEKEINESEFEGESEFEEEWEFEAMDEYIRSLSELRELYPKLPDYKFINED